jgi:hypothetical protein
MERTLSIAAVFAAAVGVTQLALAKDTAKAGTTPGKEAVTIMPGDVKWGDAPAALPKGAQLAVLHGDPTKKGMFALRFKMPDGYTIPPHWHTNAEELTVLSGTFTLGMGDNMDQASMHSLAPTAYHYLPGKMHHYAMAKDETVLELHGMGPFDIHYINPSDDPTKKSAGK